MKINAHLVTSDYRGDHSADVRVAYEPRAGELVAEFVARVMKEGRSNTDHIELRVVQEAEV